MYKEGIGVSKKLKTAFNWYMSAAQQGNVEGEYNVGNMFREGSGVKEDKEEAFQWIEKAAKKGHSSAKFVIAAMYYNGEGVEKNKYKAFEWYEKSAETGNSFAESILQFFFGITKDSTEEEIAKIREDLLIEFEHNSINEDEAAEPCDNDIITEPKEKSDREFILDYMNSANELSLPDEDNESLLRHYEEELIGIESENITDEKIEYEMSMSNEVNVNDSVGIYLKEISRIPFLHRSDELELAKRIDKRKQVTEFQEYCHNNETANIQNEIKTKEDFEESFNSLSKLLNSEYSVTDMRSLPVAFRKFDTKRRANQQYTVKNFIEDTIMFTKNDRKRFLGLLEEEKVNCTGWETKCPIRKSNYAPEIIDLVTISNGIKRLEDWVNNYYNNAINYSKNNQYDIQKDADNLIKLKIRFKNLLKEIGRQGEEANQQLLEANLKLVVYVAEWYVNRGMSFLDLIQEGNLGLIKALEKYDYTKGYRFRTHAIWWIRHAITRAIENKVRLIRIPANMIEKIKKMNRMNELLLRELGREPTPRETAELMETTESKIRRIMRIAQKPISVETIVSEAEDLQPGDIIEDYEMLSPADFASYRLMHAKVKDVLGTLSDKEREILELRYGLKDGRQRTLEEVGKHFGVTRERIRQIERQAFEKLRSSGADLIKFI